MPRLMSFCVVVSLSHLTKYASLRRLALERALAEQVVHERADVEPDLRPQRLVVGLEHDPLGAAVEALLEEQREPPDGTYLYSSASASAPFSVRAPQATRPYAGSCAAR